MPKNTNIQNYTPPTLTHDQIYKYEELYSPHSNTRPKIQTCRITLPPLPCPKLSQFCISLITVGIFSTILMSEVTLFSVRNWSIKDQL
jgi:hypothetical protein